MSHKLTPRNYSPIHWAPWGLSTAQEDPISHWEQLRTTSSCRGSPHAEGFWSKDSTTREACRRNETASLSKGRMEGPRGSPTNPLQRSLLGFILHLTHCWKEGLNTVWGLRGRRILEPPCKAHPNSSQGERKETANPRISPSLI